MLTRRSRLRSYTKLQAFTRINPKRAKPRRGPRRSPAYLEWVRGQGCCAPGSPAGCYGRVHAHHAGERGLGQRAADTTAIPLCRQHHQAWHDAAGLFRTWDHARRASWAEAVILAIQAAYAAR